MKDASQLRLPSYLFGALLALASIGTSHASEPPDSSDMPMLVDSDGDGFDDLVDNCIDVSNPSQNDTDGDGYGNNCDADLNNDCMVNFADLGLLRAVFFTSEATADLNGDGIVNVLDLGVLRAGFFSPPGPAALGDDCATPPFSEVTFSDDFSVGTVLSETLWTVNAPEGCCGIGNLASFGVDSDNQILGVNVTGGSSGFSGVGDGAYFSPVGVQLSGDFYIETELQEYSRTPAPGQKDNSGMGLFVRDAGTQEVILALEIRGNYSGYFGDSFAYNTYQGHRIVMSSSIPNLLGDGVGQVAELMRLDENAFYNVKFRLVREGGILSAGYRLSDHSEWTDIGGLGPAFSAVEPVISATSGDGGFTFENGSFVGHVDYLKVLE